MKYFRGYLGKLSYDGKEMINIFKKIDIDTSINSAYVVDYVMKDGETPESISEKLYDTNELWWTIMVINKRFDRFYDFVIPTKELNEYIQWLIDGGYLLENDIDSINEIIDDNNMKRTIKVIDNKYMRTFLFNIQQLI